MQRYNNHKQNQNIFYTLTIKINTTFLQITVFWYSCESKIYADRVSDKNYSDYYAH